MKAVTLKALSTPGDVGAVMSEIPVPEIGPGELLVEMKVCGLCGTDIEKVRGEYKAALPILGHEAVGYVTATGQDVSGFQKGDRIFPHHHVPCHGCFYCMHGNETACKRYRGSNIFPGGFSEFFKVPAWNVNGGGVLQLPSSIGFKEASLIEPVGCCIRALDKLGVAPDDTVLIVGAGPVGILHSILLRTRCARIVISDVFEPRLRCAERAGVENVIDAGKKDVASEVKGLTAGRGADAVIVASANPKAILQALRSVRASGRICLFGVPARGSVLDYDISDLYNGEISMIPSYGATERETLMALAQIDAKGESFRPVITHEFPIEEFESAVETATSGAAMKVVITS